MTAQAPMAAFLAQLGAAGLGLQAYAGLAPAQLIQVQPADWGRLAHAAKALDWRWVAAWADDFGAAGGDLFQVNACFETAGAYLVGRTNVPRTQPVLESHTLSYPCLFYTSDAAAEQR